MPANGKPNGRFELPALTPVSFSLTDGTNIPPPPESPIDEKEAAPQPATPAKSGPAQTPSSNGHNGTTNGAYDGRGRTSALEGPPPLSPASTTRPSSIRHLFSRKSLNQNYSNGHNNGSDENINAAKIVRPESSLSFLDRSTERKGGSWFKRLGSARGSNRSSVIYESPKVFDTTSVKKGPPPPKLPELNQFKAKVQNDDGSLGGGDMFKNIK